jgi:hypothetical protein
MPSTTSLLVICSAIAFTSGAVFGALALFAISIRRNGRASLFDASAQQRGAISRSVLVTTRTGHKESGK